MAGVVCRGVEAGYGDRQVLHGVDLEAAPGRWVGVIGPNGSGKSTLLRVIAGTVPGKGQIEVGGRPVGLMSRRQVARTVAVLPQNPNIPGGMRVLDYVLLGRTPYQSFWGGGSEFDLEVVHTVMEELDLDDLRGREVASLSGGERQRVVLARALAQQATVLLLDEPTAALDIGHQQEVLELVDRVRLDSGTVVISAMHDLTLAGQFAEHLLLLVAGRVAAEGSPRQVLDADVLTAQYGASVTVVAGPEGEPVVVPQRRHL
jgi:iron complex transport system ATP-binding protein